MKRFARMGMQRAARQVFMPLALGAMLCLPAVGRGMDLRQLYEASLAQDAQIRASRAAAAAGREAVPQARSQLLPNVSLSASRNYNDLTSRQPDMLGVEQKFHHSYFSSAQSLSVRQPLYRPFATAALRQAHAQVNEVEATLENDEQSLVQRVAGAYFEALLGMEQLELARAQRSAFAGQLEAATRAFAAGVGMRTDIDDAQARLDMAVAQELEAQQSLEFSRRRIEALAGQPVPELALLDAAHFVPQAPVPAALQAWVERAEESSPQLRALRERVEAARLEVEKAAAGHKPTLDAIASWSRTDSDSVTSVNSRHDQKAIGLQLVVPLYAGGLVSSQVRQAQANHERAREALEAARRDLGVQVHQEFRAMTEGILRIRALEQAVRSAAQALQSSEMSFKAGSRTMVDILNAQQQQALAQRDLAQARYQYLVSRMRLRSLAGEDRWANIDETNRLLKSAG